MSLTFTVPNFDQNIKEQGSLKVAASAGTTSLTLINNQNIKAADPLYLGTFGSETGEITTVQSTTGSLIAITSLTTLDHVANTAVTALYGDQIRLYRAANVDGSIPVDTSFTLVSSTPIDADQLTTNVIDPTGTNDFWYKATYYNSTSSVETGLSTATAARPGTVHYATLYEIRERAGFKNNRFIGDESVSSARDTAEDHINSRLSGRYVVPFTLPISPTIKEIAKMYAAGILLDEQFPYAQMNGQVSPGDKFIAWADAQLDKINAGDTPVTGANQTTTLPNGAPLDSGFSGFPNVPFVTATGIFGTQEIEGFMFQRSDIDGYHQRKY